MRIGIVGAGRIGCNAARLFAQAGHDVLVSFARDETVMFVCGDDEAAKGIVAGLIDDAGLRSGDMGGTADAAPMEPPRGPGAVYGEEFHGHDARAYVANLATEAT